MIGDLIQISDKVVVEIPQESRDWGYNPCPNGTKGVVIEFDKSTYDDKLAADCDLPCGGIYLNSSWVNIKLENGETININASMLKLANGKKYAERLLVMQNLAKFRRPI